MSGFDEYASDYDASLDQGISVSGENKLYFARGRVAFLRRCLQKLGESPGTIFDFGCGVGTSIPYLLELPGAQALTGIDASAKSLAIARKQFDTLPVELVSPGDYQSDGRFDLGFCNGVFHHIPLVDRRHAMKRIHDLLRPGGLFALWENNPWNPGTRYVMKRIPFDRDAIMLSATQASRLIEQAGFRIVGLDYLFIFPRSLHWLRGIEPALSGFPLGAQYQILCRK